VGFDASPGHSAFIFFYNQQVRTIHQENQTLRSVPPRVGRSVREPPQGGSEYKAIELIALRLRDACVGEFYLRLQAMESLNSGGIREKQWLPWVSQTPLVHELLAKKIGSVDRRRSAQPRSSSRHECLPASGRSKLQKRT